MSSGSFSRASLALRSSRGGAVWRSCGGTAALGRLSQQRRWASNSNDNKPTADGERPFYLQLNESIYERVQKEKAEQIQIQSLQQRTARGRFFATVFGTLASLTCSPTATTGDAAR
jgi:D-lactate dehydrogenase (cytochrome)